MLPRYVVCSLMQRRRMMTSGYRRCSCAAFIPTRSLSACRGMTGSVKSSAGVNKYSDPVAVLRHRWPEDETEINDGDTGVNVAAGRQHNDTSMVKMRKGWSQRGFVPWMTVKCLITFDERQAARCRMPFNAITSLTWQEVVYMRNRLTSVSQSVKKTVSQSISQRIGAKQCVKRHGTENYQT